MGSSVSPKAGRAVARFVFAALLAGTAAGCSSDVSRFGGIFSRTDNITTNSIPRQQITGLQGGAPIPSANIGSGGGVAAQQPVYGATNRQQALAQPFPSAQPSVSYDPINTATTAGSGARMASSPMKVERVALADPSATSSVRPAAALDSGKAAALAQPFPAAQPTKKQAVAAVSPDPITTGSNKSGWTTANAPSVTLRPGESIAVLSRRFGVPEKELLRANGLASASEAQVGQSIIIPALSNRNAARAAAQTADLPMEKQPLPPKPGNGEQVAVLPNGATGRNKQLADQTAKLSSAEGKVPGDTGATGTYTVKPGDSLAKIARVTGTPIDQLKQANGLTTANIRVGQKLKLSGGAADPVTTASIPQKPAAVAQSAKPVAVAAKPAPEAYKPPVSANAVTEVAKADPEDAAPGGTGIGKYRWPVRGAVVAGYGANVDGNRNDGIDISVPAGTQIKAAENGVVIYAGNGLKELGNTVLVRHDDGTVTVYGHAEKLDVQRGQKVQRGQTIAESGMSGNAKRPQVHFEVRKEATPVNPMTFLE